MNTKIFLSLIPIYVVYVTFLGMLMFRRRLLALRSKQISAGYFKAYQDEAPYELKVIQNHFSNQFEVPVVFFITCVAAVILNAADILTYVLGCLFILSRFCHSYIHLGKNELRLRAGVYFSGILLIIAMWVRILTT